MLFQFPLWYLYAYTSIRDWFLPNLLLFAGVVVDDDLTPSTDDALVVVDDG
jgi:hypothetical protein